MFKFLRAAQPPPASFVMAEREEPALPLPPAAAPAAPNPAVLAPVLEPLDVPAPVAEPEVIFIVRLPILLSGVGLASMGFGPVCLGLSASPVSLLFHTAFASLLVLSSRGVFRRFPYVFCFWLVCVSLSWFISVFVRVRVRVRLAFVFRFHTLFCGVVYLVVMHAKFLSKDLFLTLAVHLFH